MTWNEFMEKLPGLLPVLIPIVALTLVLMASALVSLVKKRVPFNQKAVWLIIILFVNAIGPILYFAVGSKSLDEKSSEGNEDDE